MKKSVGLTYVARQEKEQGVGVTFLGQIGSPSNRTQVRRHWSDYDETPKIEEKVWRPPSTLMFELPVPLEFASSWFRPASEAEEFVLARAHLILFGKVEIAF